MSMELSFCHALAEKVGLELRPSINIVIAYDDVADERRAMQTYNSLMGSLGPDCELNYELWKFEALQIPELRNLAAQQARQADMIIVASHGRTLPRSLKSWIEVWLETGSNRPRALVALMAGSAEELADSTSVYSYLHDVATRGRMEFFSHLEELPAPPVVAGFSIERLRQRAETTSFVLEEILHRARPEPRWGINE